MRITKTLYIALVSAILLAIAVAGISLWNNRPTSKGDPSRMTEEMYESEKTSDNEIFPPTIQETKAQTNELDLDVRDLAPKPSPAQVVDEQVIYDRKEIPDETTE